jgi:hypothetical protein
MAALPQSIYRSGAYPHMRNFVEEGEIMFRPLSYYRRIEDQNRRDELEGKLQSSAAGMSFEIDWTGDGNFVPAMTLDSGSITFADNRADGLFISCLSLDSKTTFGPSKLEIFDVGGFLKHLKSLLSQSGLELDHGPIDYYDPKEPPKAGLPSELWRKKRTIFEPEQEFRITFLVYNVGCLSTHEYCEIGELRNTKMPEYIKLKFGSLMNFSRLLL